MTLEQLVPTLDLCQQLKAAGFPQDTVFSWAKAKDDWGKEHWHIVSTYLATESDADRRWNDRMVKYSDGVAAPTAGELEEWLRNKYPDATISSFRRGDLGMDADIDDDVLNYHEGVGQYPTHVSALAALVLEVAG